jgi:glyoxylase-like metal-dependent hydrolase (beta-lactamase superfamily II)
MILETRAVAPFYKNGFLLGCQETREGVVIDPGDEIEDLIALAGVNQLTIRHILLTHGHVDHVAGVGRARTVFQAPTYLHRADVPLYQTAVQQGEFFGVTVDPPPPVDHLYGECPPITFGRYGVQALHTPGHTPGGVCLYVSRPGGIDERLFVGDTLFAGSIGRTDLPGGDHDTLIAAIRNVLFKFGDEAEVYPGHGPKTTIGQERRTNRFLTRL